MLNKFNYKRIGENDKLVDLSNFQKRKGEDFNSWLNNSINQNKVQLFFRGTNEEFIKDRIKKIYKKKSDNGRMRFLFEYGEKAKSYLKENIKNKLKQINFWI